MKPFRFFVLSAVLFMAAGVGAQVRRPPEVPALVPIADTSYPIPASNVVYVAPPPLGSAANTGTTAASPWTVERALAVNGAADDATIVFLGGTYRVNNLRIFKKLTLQPAPGAKVWLKGSLVIPDAQWVAQTLTSGVTVWRKDDWNYAYPPRGASQQTNPSYPEAANLDMVFVNDPQSGVVKPLVQVINKPVNGAVVSGLSQMGPGKFFVDNANNQLYIGDNPYNKIVEATAYSRAFNLFKDDANVADPSDPAGTVIRGLGFTHYARMALAIAARAIVLENNTFAWNADVGAIFFLFADGTNRGEYPIDPIVRGNTFSCNGQVGMSAGRADRLLLDNNTFRYNNVESFSRTWGAAGAKVVLSENVNVRNNVAADNFSHGLWLDVDCNDAIVVGNTVHNNGNGIFFEISQRAIIAFNVCANNGTGIVISESTDARVYNNTLSKNSRAIVVQDNHRLNDRTTDPNDFYLTARNVLKNNLLSGIRGTSTGPLLQATHYNTTVNGVYRPAQPASNWITALDTNAYYRASSSAPATLIRWSLGSSGQSFNTPYASLASFRSALASRGYERNGLDFLQVAGQPHPFFLNEAIGDLRLRAGSVAINRGEALPADIALAVGRPQSPVHLGALETAGAVPLIRLEATNNFQHFLTADQAENDFLVSTGAWRSIGPVGFVHVGASEAPGLVPLFRLYGPLFGDHFYTINPAERDAALASSYYVYEGIAGWVFAATAADRKPLYRAYNPATGQHLFTGSLTLYNGLLAPWRREGIAAYLLSAAP